MGPQMATARYGAAAAVISEFVFIVCGGYEATSAKSTNTCERYTTTQQQFYPSPSMTSARSDFALFPYPYNVVAFSTNVATVEQFDAHDNKWVQLPGYQVGQPTQWYNAELVYATEVNIQC